MMSKKITTLMQKKMKIDDDDAVAADQLPYFPQELIFDSILTRLPGRIIGKFCCVSKLWNSSTYDNKRFAEIHFIQNQNKKKLFLTLLNVRIFNRAKTCFFSLDDDCKHSFLTSVVSPDTSELVGYCNGLACITKVYKEDYGGARAIVVVNPTRREILHLHYLYPRGCEYLCHGFGFDSSTQDFKVVIVFTLKDNGEFICMVLTLGTKSWRKIVTSVVDISPPPGSSPFPKRMVTRAAGDIRTPSTLCGGDLFWRMVVENEEVIINNNYGEVHNNNNKKKSHMLLSFDIHNEKIQFVRLPTECNLTPTPTTTLVVEHHLLEHKGFLCIARSEKAIDQSLQDCNGQNSFVCRCRFTVQLYILKDTVKQVWAKGETLGVRVQQLGLAPAPFCCYFDATTATPTTFPTRILSFSDQVLLYWFDGECLKFFNFQTERLQVVSSSCSSNWISHFNFEAKMKGFPPDHGVGGDDKLYCPYMDYQLHTQVENIRSLKTFIPSGEIIEFDHGDDFLRFYKSNKNNLPAGWAITERESVKHHAFY